MTSLNPARSVDWVLVSHVGLRYCIGFPPSENSHPLRSLAR